MEIKRNLIQICYLCVLGLQAVANVSPVGAQTIQTLCYFDFTNGAGPVAELTLGRDGNFYGTTAGGGSSGYGTVFQMMTNGTLTSLVSFNSNNGAYPHAGLKLIDGNFYGGAGSGGSYGRGTLFRVTTNGMLTTLVSFNYTNGTYSVAGLVQGSDRNFYGTTVRGGTNGGFGTVFKMTTNGTLTTLVSFDGSNGASPEAGLVQGNDGNFYGTTSGGGCCGYGTVFMVTASGTLTSLVSFRDENGSHPKASLTLGDDGNFYGTTQSGGIGTNGTVFRLLLPPKPIVPPTLAMQISAGQPLLSLEGMLNSNFVVQYITNLPASNWLNLLSITNLSANPYQFLDSSSSNRPARFYRAFMQ